MRPRVSLLLIALYSVKIFCSLGYIYKSSNGQKQINSKHVPVKNDTNYNLIASCDTSCVRIYDKVNPNGRFNFRYAIMLFD